MKKQIYDIEEFLDTFIIKNGLPIHNNLESTMQSAKLKYRINSKLDDQITNDLLEDIDTKTVTITIKKRYQKIVKTLKNKYGFRCQLCGFSFHMDNGDNYCEAHHIKELSKGGSQDPNNVIILCSNHHRQFHYAREKIKILELDGGSKIVEIDGQKYIIPSNCE